MTNSNFPTSFAEVEGWSNQEGIPVLEGRSKYIQFLTLKAIADSSSLRRELVFKGGNALEFIYLENRATTDLDFTYLSAPGDLDVLKESLGERLSTALQRSDDGVGTVIRLQRIDQQPRGKDRTRVTYKVRIGWAAPGQERQRQLLLDGKPGAQIIDLDISVNENVCAYDETLLRDISHPLKVSTIEDIVAEKLRAILQQPVRRRHRNQDILDIAMIYRNLDPDVALISQFLPAKCQNRDIDPTKSAFRDPEVRERSEFGYDALRDTVRHTFIPFDEAWAAVISLVDSLDIPD
ncbi:MAG: nucleotidyl transferase AbiEii/AbiGii toxin family protein [Thermomicrobiales bacterium]|nr:nucleotidyl transferase AbiEii/AbiGii toxin family protein [Thermomicrobiales bacterium]